MTALPEHIFPDGPRAADSVGGCGAFSSSERKRIQESRDFRAGRFEIGDFGSEHFDSGGLESERSGAEHSGSELYESRQFVSKSGLEGGFGGGIARRRRLFSRDPIKKAARTHCFVLQRCWAHVFLGLFLLNTAGVQAQEADLGRTERSGSLSGSSDGILLGFRASEAERSDSLSGSSESSDPSSSPDSPALSDASSSAASGFPDSSDSFDSSSSPDSSSPGYSNSSRSSSGDSSNPSGSSSDDSSSSSASTYPASSSSSASTYLDSPGSPDSSSHDFSSFFASLSSDSSFTSGSSPPNSAVSSNSPNPPLSDDPSESSATAVRGESVSDHPELHSERNPPEEGGLDDPCEGNRRCRLQRFRMQQTARRAAEIEREFRQHEHQRQRRAELAAKRAPVRQVRRFEIDGFANANPLFGTGFRGAFGNEYLRAEALVSWVSTPDSGFYAVWGSGMAAGGRLRWTLGKSDGAFYLAGGAMAHFLKMDRGWSWPGIEPGAPDILLDEPMEPGDWREPSNALLPHNLQGRVHSATFALGFDFLARQGFHVSVEVQAILPFYLRVRDPDSGSYDTVLGNSLRDLMADHAFGIALFGGWGF